MDLRTIEEKLSEKVLAIATAEDPAHDYLHFKRVVESAKKLCAQEGGKIEVVMPAAWMHDIVIVPKNDPRRNQASRLSAESAIHYLSEINYPSHYFEDIAHAIAAHSFSANLEPRTLEAMIVQDADRLDGLGAIGIARCFATAGLMRRPFYQESDPFCSVRDADDSRYTVDHFYAKLFKTAETLKTRSGIAEGVRRAEVMVRYLKDLGCEIA